MAITTAPDHCGNARLYQSQVMDVRPVVTWELTQRVFWFVVWVLCTGAAAEQSKLVRSDKDPA